MSAELHQQAVSASPTRFALLIGAMKAGTSSLFALLAQHPEVAASHTKEPHFFTREDASDPRSDERYLRLWQQWDPSRHRVALEGSVGYSNLFRRPDTARRALAFMQRHDAEAFVIYLMRHPIERIESHLRHMAHGRPRRIVFERRRVLESAILCSSYATQLEPWVAAFGRERVLLLSFDELRHAGDALLARTCRFLGVDPEFRFSDVAEPRNKSRLVHPVARLFTHTRQIRWALSHLPERWRHRYITTVEGALAPPATLLRPDERREAARRLRPELVRLEAEYGFDTRAWLETM